MHTVCCYFIIGYTLLRFEVVGQSLVAKVHKILHLIKNEHMNKQTVLTNLEMVVVSQVRRLQPCTAHQIRVSFDNSLSGKYSSSAGSIYPLLKRMVVQGYLSVESSMNGKQNKSVYSCTANGNKATKEWVFKMDPEESFPDDPIRTRLQYLDYLTPKEQSRWIEEMLVHNNELRILVNEEYSSLNDEDFINMTVLKTVLDSIKSRENWLESLKEKMKNKGRLTVGKSAQKNANKYRPFSGTPKSKQ